MLFFRIGTLLTEDNEHSESSYYDVFCCTECSSLVLRDWVTKHIKWHESLSPAQTPEDAARERHPSGDTRSPEHPASEQDAPVLSAVHGPEGDDVDVPGYVRPMHRHTSDPTVHAHPDGGKSHTHNPLDVGEVDDCYHDWPAELYGHSECTKCGMPYDQYAYIPPV